MSKFQRGKIYSIRSYQTNEVYIGSTCQPLHKRLNDHRSHYKQCLNGKNSYVSSFEIVKHLDSYIELIELYPCNSKIELERREGEIIRIRNCVNKRIAGRTKQQYYQDNKQHIQQYQQDNKLSIQQQKKQYYQDNKLSIRQRQKQKYICDCGSSGQINKKSKHFKSIKHQQYQSIIDFIYS